MNVYMWLLLAHLLYDFHWQGDFIGIYKAKYDFLLAVHSITWALIMCAVLQYFGVLHFVRDFWWLAFTHFAIDRWKSHKPDDNKKLTTWLWVDQALHFVTVAVLFV